jgi:hypothetical protein
MIAEIVLYVFTYALYFFIGYLVGKGKKTKERAELKEEIISLRAEIKALEGTVNNGCQKNEYKNHPS